MSGTHVSVTPAEPGVTEETAETVADAAVEVAQIQADRDVAIAEINAENTETVVEAQKDKDEWREQIQTSLVQQAANLSDVRTAQEAMATQIAEIAAAVATLSAPPTPSEPNPASPQPEPNSPSSGAEDGQRDGSGEARDPEEEAPPAPRPVKRQRNWL